MHNIIKTFLILIFSAFFSIVSYAQSCTGVNAGTPSTTEVCSSFGGVTPGSGSSPCAGPGHGGAGQVRIIRFCTNASATCIQFSFSGLSSTDGTAFSLYTGCSGGVLSGLVAGSGACDGNSTTSLYTTAGLGLLPNTCYYLRVWTKNPPSFTSQVCIKANPATNDFCTGATQISPTPQALNNFCMTAGSNGLYTEPPPAEFCAGSLENNAWYTITTTSNCTTPCTVVITISNIVCLGGGAGFQLGFWSGGCTTQTYIACASGSGGTVTATLNNLLPNQTVLIGMDGNAGANCTYSMSATNTVPLPIEMLRMDVLKGDGYVDINWSTASERNNKMFTVEKSFNAIQFIEIGTVKGQELSQTKREYTLRDINPVRGVTYYRIKQTDYDGQFTYSQMRAIKYEGELKANFDIVPNPSNDFSAASLNFNYVMGNSVNVTICDVVGKVIFEKSENVKNSQYELPLLSQGIYFVRVSGHDYSVTKRMIVK